MARYGVPENIRVMNLPDAETFRERMKKRESNILSDLDDNEVLIVEYHAPTGMVVRLRDVGYYEDYDDALLLVGVDADTGDECQILASTNAVQMVFRVVKIEDGRGDRKRIGFFVAETETDVET